MAQATEIASAWTIGQTLPGGQVTDAFTAPQMGTPAPLVILIQDLHGNQAVQRNIARLLDAVNRKTDFALGVEGAEGVIDSSVMALFPDSTLKKKALDFLLSQDEISGAEYFAALRGEAHRLHGVEEQRLYLANRDQFRATWETRYALSRALAGIDQELAAVERQGRSNPSYRELRERLRLLRAVVDLQVTDEQAHAFAPKLHAYAALANELTHDAGLESFHTADIEDLLAASIDYYVMAMLRNTPMAAHAVQLAGQAPTHVAAVVAGGYHTHGITAQLRAQGISYVVITPDVPSLSEAEHVLYIQRLNGHFLSEDAVIQAAGRPLAPFQGSIFRGFARQLTQDFYSTPVRNIHFLDYVFAQVGLPTLLSRVRAAYAQTPAALQLVDTVAKAAPADDSLVHQESGALDPRNAHFGNEESGKALAITAGGTNESDPVVVNAKDLVEYFESFDSPEEFPIELQPGSTIRVRIPASQAAELDAAGWTHEARSALLRKGLETRIRLSGSSLTPGAIQAFAADHPTLLFALVDTSEHLWDYDAPTGAIFMNRALLEFKQAAKTAKFKDEAAVAADALFAAGMSHEFGHALLGQGAALETELARGDGRVVGGLFSEQGSNRATRLRLLLESSTLLDARAIDFYVRQTALMARITRFQTDLSHAATPDSTEKTRLQQDLAIAQARVEETHAALEEHAKQLQTIRNRTTLQDEKDNRQLANFRKAEADASAAGNTGRANAWAAAAQKLTAKLQVEIEAVATQHDAGRAALETAHQEATATHAALHEKFLAWEKQTLAAKITALEEQLGKSVVRLLQALHLMTADSSTAAPTELKSKRVMYNPGALPKDPGYLDALFADFENGYGETKIATHKELPTILDVAEHMGIADATLRGHLNRLVHAGYSISFPQVTEEQFLQKRIPSGLGRGQYLIVPDFKISDLRVPDVWPLPGFDSSGRSTSSRRGLERQINSRVRTLGIFWALSRLSNAQPPQELTTSNVANLIGETSGRFGVWLANHGYNMDYFIENWKKIKDIKPSVDAPIAAPALEAPPVEPMTATELQRANAEPEPEPEPAAASYTPPVPETVRMERSRDERIEAVLAAVSFDKPTHPNLLADLRLQQVDALELIEVVARGYYIDLSSFMRIVRETTLAFSDRFHITLAENYRQESFAEASQRVEIALRMALARLSFVKFVPEGETAQKSLTPSDKYRLAQLRKGIRSQMHTNPNAGVDFATALEYSGLSLHATSLRSWLASRGTSFTAERELVSAQLKGQVELTPEQSEARNLLARFPNASEVEQWDAIDALTMERNFHVVKALNHLISSDPQVTATFRVESTRDFLLLYDTVHQTAIARGQTAEFEITEPITNGRGRVFRDLLLLSQQRYKEHLATLAAGNQIEFVVPRDLFVTVVTEDPVPTEEPESHSQEGIAVKPPETPYEALAYRIFRHRRFPSYTVSSLATQNIDAANAVLTLLQTEGGDKGIHISNALQFLTFMGYINNATRAERDQTLNDLFETHSLPKATEILAEIFSHWLASYEEPQGLNDTGNQPPLELDAPSTELTAEADVEAMDEPIEEPIEPAAVVPTRSEIAWARSQQGVRRILKFVRQSRMHAEAGRRDDTVKSLTDALQLARAMVERVDQDAAVKRLPTYPKIIRMAKREGSPEVLTLARRRRHLFERKLIPNLESRLNLAQGIADLYNQGHLLLPEEVSRLTALIPLLTAPVKELPRDKAAQGQQVLSELRQRVAGRREYAEWIDAGMANAPISGIDLAALVNGMYADRFLFDHHWSTLRRLIRNTLTNVTADQEFRNAFFKTEAAERLAERTKPEKITDPILREIMEHLPASGRKVTRDASESEMRTLLDSLQPYEMKATDALIAAQKAKWEKAFGEAQRHATRAKGLALYVQITAERVKVQAPSLGKKAPGIRAEADDLLREIDDVLASVAYEAPLEQIDREVQAMDYHDLKSYLDSDGQAQNLNPIVDKIRRELWDEQKFRVDVKSLRDSLLMKIGIAFSTWKGPRETETERESPFTPEEEKLIAECVVDLQLVSFNPDAPYVNINAIRKVYNPSMDFSPANRAFDRLTKPDRGYTSEIKKDALKRYKNQRKGGHKSPESHSTALWHLLTGHLWTAVRIGWATVQLAYHQRRNDPTPDFDPAIETIVAAHLGRANFKLEVADANWRGVAADIIDPTGEAPRILANPYLPLDLLSETLVHEFKHRERNPALYAEARTRRSYQVLRRIPFAHRLAEGSVERYVERQVIRETTQELRDRRRAFLTLTPVKAMAALNDALKTPTTLKSFTNRLFFHYFETQAQRNAMQQGRLAFIFQA